MPANATVTNIEIIINNIGSAAFGSVDASKFVGATSINQNGFAGSVVNLAATTTAGFKGVDTTVAGPLKVMLRFYDPVTHGILFGDVKGKPAHAG